MSVTILLVHSLRGGYVLAFSDFNHLLFCSEISYKTSTCWCDWQNCHHRNHRTRLWANSDLVPHLFTAPGVQHLRPLPGGTLLRLPVPAEGLARPQEAVSRAQAGAGPGVGARTMICPHPRLGEEEGGQGAGRGRARLLDFWEGSGGWSAKRVGGGDCWQETNDRGQCWLLDCLTDSGGKKMEEGKEDNAKRHLPLPRTGNSP